MRSAVFVVLLAGALVAGCAQEPAEVPAAAVSPAASPSPSLLWPVDELQAALALLKTTSYRYTVAGGYPSKKATIRASGAHDPATHRLTRTVTVSGLPGKSGRQLVIGQEIYQTSGATWVRADPGRANKLSKSLTIDPQDPDGLTRFAQALTTVVRPAPHAFEGSLYVLATPGKTGFLPLGAPSFNPARDFMPEFTAATDAQGHVTSINVMFRSEGRKIKQTITFSGYGEPVVVSKPVA